MDAEAGRFGGDPKEAMEKFVGVCLDGRQISFVRFSRSGERHSLPVALKGPAQLKLFEDDLLGFQEFGPFPIDAGSISALLVYARGAVRLPLTASRLAEAFGPGADRAQRALMTFYTIVRQLERQRASSRTKRFYQEWDRLFGVVYGQEIARAQQAVEETADVYGLPRGPDLKPLLFSVHTYYAFLMKLIAIELLALQPKGIARPFAAEIAQLDDAALRNRLTDLESGHEFSRAGIDNFLEADFFGWYLDVWNPRIAAAMRELARTLGSFEPATPRLEPRWTQDLLRNVYEFLVPKKLRHDLGEYYTPDWLARHLLDRAGYRGNPSKRFLDPACGSGTFLLHAIRRILDREQRKASFDPVETGRTILAGVAGFDLNPVAVLTARTNYLIALSDLIPHLRPLSLPVYLCDSVVPLEPAEEPGKLPYGKGTLVFSTHDREYVFPVSMKSQERMDLFTAEVDKALRAGISESSFTRRIRTAFSTDDRETRQLVEVYRQIKELHDRGEDGIWARYLKNAFAPEYMGRFEFVIGNPPWIRWKYLSDDYRKRTLRLWHELGIFSLKGHEARLGGGEKDFSMLFTYASADRFLKDGGTLAFLITETVFKARGGGEGFRRFRILKTDTPLKLLVMEDLVHLQPFLTASNKTCLFALRRGEKTTYPVEVIRWMRKKGVGKIPTGWTLDKVLEETVREDLVAVPVDPRKEESSWQTVPKRRLTSLKRMKGVNPYQARRGADTAPYGVFRLRVSEVRPDGILVVEGMSETGRTKLEVRAAPIESALVYPAVNGPEIRRFGFEDPFHLLMTQHPGTRKPHPVDWMETHAPMTLAYLRPFEKLLLNRGSKPIAELARKTAFYAMFGIGDYSVAPYRVTWARTTSRMAAVVMSKMKTRWGAIKEVIGCDDTAFVPLNDREEAHYLCAVMNSSSVREFLYAAKPSGHVAPPSAVKPLAIPRFKKSDRRHGRLAVISERAHELVARGKEIAELDAEIDKLVERLWTTER